MRLTEEAWAEKDAKAARVCHRVATEFVNFKHACAIEDLSYESWKTYTTKEGEIRPSWVDMRDKARYSAVVHWMKVLQDSAAGKNNPGVKAAEFMLSALDPDRFREKQANKGPGIIVQFLGGEGPKTIEATVIGGDDVKQLEEGA